MSIIFRLRKNFNFKTVTKSIPVDGVVLGVVTSVALVYPTPVFVLHIIRNTKLKRYHKFKINLKLSIITFNVDCIPEKWP